MANCQIKFAKLDGYSFVVVSVDDSEALAIIRAQSSGANPHCQRPLRPASAHSARRAFRSIELGQYF